MRKIVVMVLLALLAASPAMAAEVNLSVAASLKEVVNDLCDRFAKRHPDVRFLKNYGGSGQLARQIESGAPGDIFISANVEWMEYLKGKKLVDAGSIGIFTHNTLVFAGTSGKASSLRDLVKLERIAIGSPKSVPAGEYAMEALTRAGVAKQVEKKLVMTKDVRECLMYADRGEVDGGFVYRTDALQAKKARILFTVPANLHDRIVYPLALTVTGARNPEAAAFLSFLKGAEAKKVLEKYGFSGQ
ncbi:molybdate ABC transporter substrate-binding protein [Geomonas sp. Red32]|uniref:molybdate ABC transporter substrate-binding protein n=1 Tax=Geomonas sp. Red32 TaxID=2912856 RepID=UPI00202CD4A5|nr:molybdate ABC transporter substrate-binding protein [Geomonas sp. Red32]MCM0082440.1 molybdate ABC transporter substrate-binding protein [Geomonas sp. Red32]